MLARAHVLISGEVQGVFFRDSTRNKALGLGIRGWVRNLRNGRVEAVFEGEREKVDEIVRWCHRGPRSARVEGVELRWEDFKDEFKGFEVRYF